ERSGGSPSARTGTMVVQAGACTPRTDSTCPTGRDGLASWNGREGRVRVGDCGTHRSLARPDWTRPDRRTHPARPAMPWSLPSPFREERKSLVVATVAQLAALVCGRLVGDGSVPIRSARPVGEAGPGDITFIENERFAKLLRGSPASAAIVGPHFTVAAPDVGQGLAVIEVDDPMAAFLAVRSHLNGAQRPRWTGIHPQA